MRKTDSTMRLPTGVWLSAGSAVAVLLATSARYGFHRDELYFVVAGRNLAWGYVDQPPFTPLIARISEEVGSASPIALRLLPALAVGLVAVLAAMMARRFGGDRVAQVFAAFTTAFTGVLLGEGHLLSTAVFDYAFWAMVLLLVVILLDDGDPRLWLAVGAVIGIGLLNKHLIGFLAVAILVGLVATPARALLRTRWPWMGAALAVLIALPNLVWQASHGWPQLEMAAALRSRSDGPLAFVLFQPLLLSITLVIPAVAGLWWLARSDEARRWRPIAVTYAVLFGTFLATGAKAYYIAPMNAVLLAAGAVWFERKATTARRATVAAVVIGVAIGIVVALPVLPIDRMSTFDATGELGETVGWDLLVDDVRGVYQSIPEAERNATIVFTGSYGEAGAIDVIGVPEGLPPSASGHNNYWLWGPPAAHGAVIGVGDVGDVMRTLCDDVVQTGTLSNPYGVENETAGQRLWLCRNPHTQLSDIWAELRHFN